MVRKDIRAEAADLLACLASQPEKWNWFCRPMTLPGRWSQNAIALSGSMLDDIGVSDNPDLDWRENYAEAEARLRETTHG